MQEKSQGSTGNPVNEVEQKTDHVKLTGWKLEVPLLATPDYGQTVLRRLSRISQHFLGAKSTPQIFCCFGLIFSVCQKNELTWARANSGATWWHFFLQKDPTAFS